MGLMVEQAMRKAAGEPLETVVDLGYVNDQATRDRADLLIAAGIGWRNFSSEGFGRLLVRIPPTKRAVLSRFPIREPFDLLRGDTRMGGRESMAAPTLKWPGGKWMLAGWIIEHLPPHKGYCEPFFGSGAVLFLKPRSAAEIVNDRSGSVVNLFRVIRDDTEALRRAVELTPWAREEYEFCTAHRGEETDPVEQARRFLVGCWQQIGCRYGTEKGTWTGGWRTSRMSNSDPTVTWCRLPARIAVAARRLRGVNVENRPALDVIHRFDSPDVLHYCDPPYPLSVRDRSMYEHEMTDADHLELLDALDAHPGPAIISGYWCDLYAERLAHWRCVRRRGFAQSKEVREECLWLSPAAVARLGQPRLLDMEDGRNA